VTVVKSHEVWQKVTVDTVDTPRQESQELQCVAVCCSVLQCVAVCCSVLQCVAVCCSVMQCVAVCCSVLQCVAVCCSVLQCVAVCCSVLTVDTPRQESLMSDIVSRS